MSLLPLVSSRNAHVARLYDLVRHLVSLPPSPATHTRTVRAWRALAQCREVHLSVLWHLGAAIIERTREGGSWQRGGSGRAHDGDDGDNDDEARWRAGQRAEWLKFNQEGAHDRVLKFNEYCLALVAAGRAEFALDELERCASLSLLSFAVHSLILTLLPFRASATSTTSRTTTRSRSTRCTASSPSTSPCPPRRARLPPPRPPPATRPRQTRKAAAFAGADTATGGRRSAKSSPRTVRPFNPVRNLFLPPARIHPVRLTCHRTLQATSLVTCCAPSRSPRRARSTRRPSGCSVLHISRSRPTRRRVASLVRARRRGGLLWCV